MAYVSLSDININARQSTIKTRLQNLKTATSSTDDALWLEGEIRKLQENIKILMDERNRIYDVTLKNLVEYTNRGTLAQNIDETIKNNEILKEDIRALAEVNAAAMKRHQELSLKQNPNKKYNAPFSSEMSKIKSAEFLTQQKIIQLKKKSNEFAQRQHSDEPKISEIMQGKGADVQIQASKQISQNPKQSPEIQKTTANPTANLNSRSLGTSLASAQHGYNDTQALPPPPTKTETQSQKSLNQTAYGVHKEKTYKENRQENLDNVIKAYDKNSSPASLKLAAAKITNLLIENQSKHTKGTFASIFNLETIERLRSYPELRDQIADNLKVDRKYLKKISENQTPKSWTDKIADALVSRWTDRSELASRIKYASKIPENKIAELESNLQKSTQAQPESPPPRSSRLE